MSSHSNFIRMMMRNFRLRQYRDVKYVFKSTLRKFSCRCPQIIKKLISRQLVSSSDSNLLYQQAPILCKFTHHYFRCELTIFEFILILDLNEYCQAESPSASQRQYLLSQIDPVQSECAKVLSVFQICKRWGRENLREGQEYQERLRIRRNLCSRELSRLLDLPARCVT